MPVTLAAELREPSAKRVSKATVAHLGILVLLWALFFWRFAAPNPGDRWALADGDFTQQFGVFRDLVYRALVTGHAPLWADCLLSGYPLHADPQTQLFYFPAWITYAVLRLGGWGHYPIEALTAEGLVHYLLVSILLYAFLRGEVRRPAAALFGAVVFTYSGYLTGFPVLQTATIETLTWLPLVLLCLRRLADTRRPGYLAGAAVALAVAYFGGHPQTFVYLAGVALAYLAFRARLANIRWRMWAAWAAGLAALTAALSAVQLLPSLQFISLSTRASIPFDEASRGLAFQDIIQFFLTGLLSQWHYLYIGILPLALAVFAGLADRRSVSRFWGGIALASLLFSFGTQAVAYDAAYWLLPPFRLIRGQEHFSLVVVFSLSVLAALGADLCLGPLASRARRTLRGLAKGAVYLIAISLGLLAILLVSAQTVSGDGRQLAAWVGRLALFAILAALALHARLAWPAARRWWGAFILLAAVLDLFAVNRGTNASPLFQAYAGTPLVEPIRAETGFFRVQDDFQLKGHAGCGYGFWQVEGITPYRLATYQAFLDRAPETVRWQLLGVRFVVTWQQELLSPDGAPLPVEVVAQLPSAPGVPNAAGITKVYRLRAVDTRRAFLAHEVKSFPNDDALYTAMGAPDFAPYSTALVRESSARAPAGASENLAGSQDFSRGVAAEAVTVTADSPGHVTVTAKAGAPGLLVLSGAWYPGWAARVDGASAPVILVDGGLLAAPIGEGEHVVSFDYRPSMLLLGGVVSLAALVAAALVAGRRSRR